MIIGQYDRVLLKDGREASIVEILSADMFVADIDDADGKTDTDFLGKDKIDKVIRKAS